MCVPTEIYFFDHLLSLKKAKNMMPYKDSAVIINQVNLTQKLTYI